MTHNADNSFDSTSDNTFHNNKATSQSGKNPVPPLTQSTVCPLDCADTCSLEVFTEGETVTKVRGGAANPFTRGKLCAKVVNAFPAQVHGDLRIRTPLLRRDSLGGRDFQAISWEQALDIIHERFSQVASEWGSEAIAPLYYGGPMGILAGGSMDRRFFHKLGASLIDASTLCAGTSGHAWDTVFGDAGGIDVAELAEARLIVVWGNNITTCNLHLTTLIRDAQKRGAKLVVIDPKRTRIARDADLHVPLLPGSDVALAYAVTAILDASGDLDEAFIEEHTHGGDQFRSAAKAFDLEHAAGLCGLDAGLIEALADMFRKHRPAAMSIGVAPERNRNGSAGIRAAFSLMAVTGNIGPHGAGICDVSRFFPIDRQRLSRPDLAPENTRTLNVLDIPRYVLDPGDETPIKALFIYNHNPVAVHPQQGRMRDALLSDEVFVVGSDITMTDSMTCADLVLPASTHFEYGDIYKAYGHRYLQRSRPVIPAQGEAVSNMELFRRLAARFGYTEAVFQDSDDAMIHQAFAATDSSIPEKADNRALDMTPYAKPAMLRGGEFTTPSGRIELYSEAMEAHCGQGLPAYLDPPEKRDFVLVTPASELRTNSTFGGIEEQQRDILCEIHSADATAREIKDGEVIELFNERAAVQLTVRISDDVRQGTLYVPKGAWIADSPTGCTVNALLPGHQESAIGGACYYDCAVDIRPPPKG
ncbi:molybdopterin-containing oxidoreductase family protein [Congregibacter litoralis]|uniref:Anaerobic dehydrogenase, typically selenocysteine-containing n=1 Tax=Congregibacter litoralis KT71 TaxID=314285 RepID=A4A9U4_9GAMM|nr:molybdopterin-dependent oxidoreductase [Congregibacter litoralis]EAQ97261.1 Anaerobic dehydrogenase, typically selenocysteine-containing [Congregibacter litoralis KT71]